MIIRLANAIRNKTLKPVSKEDLITVRKIISQQIKSRLSSTTKEWVQLDGAKSVIRQQINYDQIRNDYLSFTIIVKLDTGTIIMMTFVVDDKNKNAVADYVVKMKDNAVAKSQHPKKVPATINFTNQLVEFTFNKISEIIKDANS